jgi:streptomycin 6-kinase
MEGPISCNFPCSPLLDPELDRLTPYWRSYWPETDPGRLAVDLCERLTAAITEWGLAELQPLGGGVVALVCAATYAGRPVVVKLNPRGHPDDRQLAAEGAALRFWQPTGAAVELLAQRDGGFTLLMERLQPGDPLDQTSLSREDQLEELGRLAAWLHSAGPPPRSFMHLRDHVPGWCGAVPELDELLVPDEGDVLVHLDLHGGNALRTGAGWKVIDPKGVRADRHADIWALLDPNGLALLPDDPEDAAATAGRWLARYVEAATLDPVRARDWTRLRARAEALDCGSAPDPDTASWVAALHRMANALG